MLVDLMFRSMGTNKLIGGLDAKEAFNKICRAAKNMPAEVIQNMIELGASIYGVEVNAGYVGLPGLCTDSTLAEIKKRIDSSLESPGEAHIVQIMRAEDNYGEVIDVLIIVTIFFVQPGDYSYRVAEELGAIFQNAVDETLGSEQNMHLPLG